MKFGRRFYQSQVAEWSEFYVDYNRLKQLCKALSSTIDIHGVLLDESRRIHQFYIEKYDHIHQKFKVKNRGRHQPYQEWLSTVAENNNFEHTYLKQLDECQLKQLSAALSELQAELGKLHWYGHVNCRAIEKLMCRMGRFSMAKSSNEDLVFPSEQLETQSKCLGDLERLNRALTAILNIHEGQPSLESGFSHPGLCAHVIKTCSGSRNSLKLNLNTVENQYPTILQSSLGLMTPPFNDNSPHLLASSDITSINEYIHNLVVGIGRERLPSFSNSVSDTSSQSSQTLVTFLNGLPPNWRLALHLKDPFGRLAIHYAAEYGLDELCREILRCLKDWGHISDLTTGILSQFFEDCELSTPLHLSVLNGHFETTKVLLKSLQIRVEGDACAILSKSQTILGRLLLLALKSGHVDISRLLIESGADTSQFTKYNETPLYLAAQAGHEKILELLIVQKELLDLHETTNHRTALIVAAIEGHKNIVQMLIKAGADTKKRDLSDWAAIDHAGWRGHLEVAEALHAHRENSPSILNEDHISAKKCQASSAKEHKLLTAVTSGHLARVGNLLSDKSLVIVHLGSWDEHNKMPVLNLSLETSRTVASVSDLTSCFSIGISDNDGDLSNNIIQLPIAEDITNLPIIFSTSNPSQFKIRFDLFCYLSDPNHTNGKKNVLIGSGVALLIHLQQCLGPERESLVRNYTVPILEKNTLKYIAAVTFSFIIAMPFSHKEMDPIPTDRLWSPGGPTKVIGHRGMGQNTVLPKYPQLGENTIQSYLTAVNLGASYVENVPDVQLTKDHIPVIYHDFLVSETGTDSPMHTLTLDQFMHISHSQSESLHSDISSADGIVRGTERTSHKRIRSNSFNESDESRTKAFRDRIKHTWDFKNTGYKGNTRGDYIHQPFTTLAEVLQRLPPSMPLDIELKYPMLWEATDWYKIDLYAVELNLFVDTILSCIFRYACNRPITLCSFSPEVCILLALKQARYPILFGNDSGNYPAGDVRASNLQEAVHFANRWNLDGLAVASEPLVMAPKLIGKIKSHDLVCVSYGNLNDEPQNAKIQADSGLDVLLVNKIALITKTLNA